METKLKRAITSGKRERAKLLEVLGRPDESARRRAAEEISGKRQAWEAWIAESFYTLVRKAVSGNEDKLVLGYAGKDIPRHADEVLVNALNNISGVSAVLRSDYVNMQDSSAPCWETVYWVDVTWKKK